MTVLKLTSTKKGIQIIDDDGRVYLTSVNFVLGLIYGKAKGDFILTKRMPYNVSPDRFKPSELWDPEGVFEGESKKTLSVNEDALSKKSRNKRAEEQLFEDEFVWE